MLIDSVLRGKALGVEGYQPLGSLLSRPAFFGIAAGFCALRMSVCRRMRQAQITAAAKRCRPHDISNAGIEAEFGGAMARRHAPE